MSSRDFLKRSLLPFLIGLFLLFPQCIVGPFGGPWSWKFGLPKAVVSGDEPHYLLQVHSLLEDHDLNLRNNYESVMGGSDQAGSQWAGKRMHHHTVWFQGEERMDWMRLVDWEAWKKNPNAPVVPFRKGIAIDESRAEYPVNAPGYPVLLSLLLLPFKGTPYVESMALLCSGIATLLALVYFRRLISKYNPDPFAVNFASVLTFLGTPLWYYSRTLYPEPYLLLFVLASYELVLKRDKALLAGIALALGVLFKPPFLLLSLPLLFKYLREKNWKKTLSLLLPIFVAYGTLLIYQHQILGSFSKGTMIWRGRDLWDGIFSYLWSPERGLFFYAPGLLIAFFGWPLLFREARRDAFILFLGFLVYFILMSLWFSDGGYCFGPRLLLPVLPFLMVPLVKVPQTKLFLSKIFKAAAAIVVLIAVEINFWAAIQPWRFIARNPLQDLIHQILG